MNRHWNHKEAAEATKGKASGRWQAMRVEIDSRKVQPGDLFVAIKGERVDGHAYVADALKRGAAAAMVSAIPQGMNEDAPLLLVEDTLKGLEDLARHARATTKAKIVGITGSVGKTSSKEMLKLALAAHGVTFASSGNYNNHIGLPLNLANLPVDAKFAIVEMGMNHAGEIAHLTRIARPDVAAITNVEAVHLEFFDSVESIAEAKGEIFEGVTKGGWAVLPADSKHCERLQNAAMRFGVAHTIHFGEQAKAECRLVSYHAQAKGAAVEANIAGKSLRYELAATGKQWALASLLSLAVAQTLELNVEKSAAALAKFSEPEGRGRVIALESGALLVDDSYNASPASMRAAIIKTAEVWEGAGKKGRKVAALGDMLELGATSPSLHASLAEILQQQKFDLVFTSGKLMEHLQSALPANMRAQHAAKAAELLAPLSQKLRCDDVLLIKGSHGSRMYELAESLKGTKEKKHAV